MTAPLPPRRPLSAGQEIDAFCTRCKLDLGHRIVAMVGQAPKRVLCMTCGSEHNYRAPKPAPGVKVTKTPGVSQSSSKTSGSKTSGSKAKAAGGDAARAHRPKASHSREEWEKRTRSGAPFRRYLATERYEEGELIDHKKFGEGFIAQVLGGDKLIAVFIDGEKTLVHGLSA